MEFFNAKEYIVDDLSALMNEGPKEEKAPNYTISLLPDGKKGFTIHRSKKAMTLDYENGQFLNETGKVMYEDDVYKFMSALTTQVIKLPKESGFTRIMKGKAKILELYRTVTREDAPTMSYETLRELVINGFAFISISEGSDYDDSSIDREYKNKLNVKICERVSSVFLHYMTPEEFATILSHKFWECPISEIEYRKRELFEGFDMINELLNHYSPQDIFVYLDEWMASPHNTFPETKAVKSLFEGEESTFASYGYKPRMNFTDIDILDGHDYQYTGYRDNDAMRDSDAFGNYYYRPNSTFFVIPSREKIEIPINDFTQMAVYGAIAQGFMHEITTFFVKWRKNIDFQLYFHEAVTEYSIKYLSTSNAVYKQREADIIAGKAAEAYRKKQLFYVSEIKRLRIPVPVTIPSETGQDLILTLASESDVAEMVKKYYQRSRASDKLWNILNMFRKNAVPMSLISQNGVVFTRFFDMEILFNDTNNHRYFYHQDKKYECASLSDKRSRMFADSRISNDGDWVMPKFSDYNECNNLYRFHNQSLKSILAHINCQLTPHQKATPVI